jgi:hypothetical protein
MNIRLFQDFDTELVIALWNQVFSDKQPHNNPALVINQKLATQPELFFVAEIDSVIVGTIMAGYDGHRGWLYTVAVNPQYWYKASTTCRKGTYSNGMPKNQSPSTRF